MLSFTFRAFHCDTHYNFFAQRQTNDLGNERESFTMHACVYVTGSVCRCACMCVCVCAHRNKYSTAADISYGYNEHSIQMSCTSQKYKKKPKTRRNAKSNA